MQKNVLNTKMKRTESIEEHNGCLAVKRLVCMVFAAAVMLFALPACKSGGTKPAPGGNPLLLHQQSYGKPHQRSGEATMVEKSFVSGKNDLERITRHFAGPDRSDPWCWLFYGDSITHGAGHTHGWRSFPEIFAERVRWEIQHRQDIVINTGISGNTSADLLREYNWRCRHWHPQVVFLLIGINDIVRLDDIALFRENLIKLVRQVRADGAIPILQTYPPIQKHPENPAYWKRYQEMPSYNETIRQIAQREDVVLIDHDRRWREFASDPEAHAARLGESIHPGAFGHLEMAKEIFRKFNVYDPKANSCNPVGSPFSIPPVKE